MVMDSNALHNLPHPSFSQCVFHHCFFHEISAPKIRLFVLFCFPLLHDSLLSEARPAFPTRLWQVATRTTSVTGISHLIAETVVLIDSCDTFCFCRDAPRRLARSEIARGNLCLGAHFVADSRIFGSSLATAWHQAGGGMCEKGEGDV